MNLIIGKDPVPLKTDANGAVRVSGTRVTLDSVIATFKQGAVADEIVLRFPVLPLADVYSVLSFYLRNMPEVERYIKEREGEAKQILEEAEFMTPRYDVRQRLLARQAKTG